MSEDIESKEQRLNVRIEELQKELEKLNLVAPGSFTREQQNQEKDYPPEFAVRLARLRAAEVALRLAADLLLFEKENEAYIIRQSAEKLEDQVKEWRRSGRGWFEERMIKKPYYPTQVVLDERGNPVYLLDAQGNPRLDRDGQPIPRLDYVRDDQGNPVISYKLFGPYYYFRWRNNEGKMQTIYFGKARPQELDERQPEPASPDQIDFGELL